MNGLCCKNPVITSACCVNNLVGIRKKNILNTSAPSANYMMMRGGVSIKMIDTVTDIKSVDFSDIRQKGQIPINGTQADIGILLTNMHINCVSSGMILSTYQKGLNAFSLTTIFQRFNHLLYNNNDYCFYYTRNFLFVNRFMKNLYIIHVKLFRISEKM